MQAQLDEIARGLISAFAETAPPLPDAAGLFTWSGAPNVPTTLVNGLAGQISVNAAFDPDQAGDVSLLRDGGANGAGYVANTAGTASFADRLIAFGDRLDQPMSFSPATGITASSSVTAYSANAIGWLENARQQATTQADTREALAARTAEALSNATGVNIDMEMSLMLDLEHTYQASARLLTTVDEMLKTLLNAV
jgi:flagellar hook-associated protein 1 FlgK